MIFRFDDFELDTDRIELRFMDDVVHLEPKSYELLEFLVHNRDRVPSKDEIFDQIWPDVFVTEASLTGAIKNIRKALGDDGTTQKFIKTVRGRGFRFIADVTPEAVPATALPPAPSEVKSDAKGPPGIAVLPFSLLGTHDIHSAISDAIPTELIMALTKTKSVNVIARGSSFRFHSDTYDIDEVRHRLGAQYIVSGSIEISGNRISVHVDLTTTSHGTTLWAERFVGTIEDVFEMRQSIVEAVASAVDVRVPMTEADQFERMPGAQLDAWGHYHVGLRHLFRFTSDQNDQAIERFERAIEIDPGFARAHAGLALSICERHNTWQNASDKSTLQMVLDHAARAVDADPFDPFCNAVFGQAKWIDHDLDTALHFGNAATALNPHYAYGQFLAGKFHAIACHSAEADKCIETSLKLSPIDPNLQSMLSVSAYSAFTQDDRQRALEFAERSARAPNAHNVVLVVAAAIFAAYGKMDKAEAIKTRLGHLEENFITDHFAALFTLRDEARNEILFQSIRDVGLGG